MTILILGVLLPMAILILNLGILADTGGHWELPSSPIVVVAHSTAILRDTYGIQEEEEKERKRKGKGGVPEEKI